VLVLDVFLSPSGHLEWPSNTISPTTAEPKIIQSVSRLEKAIKKKLAIAIAIETGPCNASRASGTVDAAINPAAASVNVWIALRTGGFSARAPT